MTPIWVVALCGLLFGCAAYLAVQMSAAICKDVAPFDDGPPPGKPPVAWLIGGAVLLGVMTSMHGAPLPQLGLMAALCVVLVACAHSDVTCGIVPDYFTLVPLALVVACAVLMRAWSIPLSMLAALPFAIAAFFSKGRGMGWGDVKLIALGSAVVGFQMALFAFSLACMAAAAVAVVRRRRNQPIAFAPYIASAIGFTVALSAV